MNLRQKRIVVLGSVNMDYSMVAECLPRPGETVIGESLTVSAGGKGGNQAVAASNAGVTVDLIGCVGSDNTGAHLLSLLKELGLSLEHVKVSGSLETGLAFIVVDHVGENTIVVNSGANKDLYPLDLLDAGDTIAEASFAIAQLEMNVETVLAFAQMCKDLDTKFLLNAAPYKMNLPKELLKLCSYLVVNMEESAQISGQIVTNRIDAISALEMLRNMGASNPIITLGSEGLVTIMGNELIQLTVPKMEVVDTTGAGDAFVGTFAACIVKDYKYLDALIEASAVAALSCTFRGTQDISINRSEILALKSQCVIEVSPFF